MERPERVILLGLGLLLGSEMGLLWVLVAFVVLTGITALQRILFVWRTAATNSVASSAQSTAPASRRTV